VLQTCWDMAWLLGKGGLYGQTVRLPPPMCLHEQDTDFLLDVLDRAFTVI
jgi:alanine-glyoxylate transaminase/(R)-3-amino-2-methylpropionate-pyruvate transaminase